MSARYRFELATEADDAQLRARMAEDRMEGRASATEAAVAGLNPRATADLRNT